MSSASPHNLGVDLQGHHRTRNGCRWRDQPACAPAHTSDRGRNAGKVPDASLKDMGMSAVHCIFRQTKGDSGVVRACLACE
jgi:hypothetical protein